MCLSTRFANKDDRAVRRATEPHFSPFFLSGKHRPHLLPSLSRGLKEVSELGLLQRSLGHLEEKFKFPTRRKRVMLSRLGQERV